MNNKILTKYAKLLVEIGVNLQRDDVLVINCTHEGLDLARKVSEQAYLKGAKKVELMFSDEQMALLNYTYQSEQELTHLDQWYIDRYDHLVDTRCCYISILAEDPDIFESVNPILLAKVSKARHQALKKYFNAATSNLIRWCLCAVPNANWAKKIFPDDTPSRSISKLWDMIFKTMRLDQSNPVKAWQSHIQKLQDMSEFLTKAQFVKFELTNSLGTNLSVGMPKGYYFSGGHESSQDGIGFTANMPTEEVFSLPDKNKVNGIVYSALPLIHNGSCVDNFWIKFNDGRIVDYDAKVGKDTLKGIIETDDGSHYLGEIAFVQYDSPIRNLDTLFYNTLFDENASCHLAIGEAYPMIEGIENMSADQRTKMGVNTSCTHVDFMIGTKDMSIVGIKENGERVDIMKNGNFVCLNK